jgi:hypothetical protein
MAGPGEARQGKAGRCEAWLGKAFFKKMIFHGQARQGQARPGMAGQGMARQDKARRGKAFKKMTSNAAYVCSTAGGKMTFKELCLELCDCEKGESEINIAQMREVISKLKKLIQDDPSIIALLVK